MRWKLAIGSLVALGAGVGIYLLIARRPRRLPPARAVAVPSLPYARRTTEGYVLGAMPGFRDRSGVADVAALDALGIKAVVSLAQPPEDVQQAIRAKGMWHYQASMGSNFGSEQARALSEAVDRFDPEEIYVHCMYGVDRTGAGMAYLLVTQHDWPVDQAIWSVLADTQADRDGLQEILAARGITTPPPANVISINSLRAVGSRDGLKVRGAYRENGSRVVNSLLDTLGAG